MSACDLAGVAEGAGAAHLDGDVQRLERVRIRRDPVFLLPGEDQEVAELATAGIDLGPDVAGDLRRVLSLDVALVARVRQREDVSGDLLVRIGIERSEPRGVHGRLRRKSRLKDLVRPVAQLGRRAEVERQRQHAADAGLAEALADDVVDVDVGAAEAVDRLLRVADDEQRAGPQRNLPPVRGSRQASRQTRPRRLPRARTRSRPGSDRCPGTRPRADTGTSAAAPGARRRSRGGRGPSGGGGRRS